jgi:hypothetical protein
MTGVNDRVLAVIRGFLDLSDDEQGQTMEVLSEYYIADSSARRNFVSEVRKFASAPASSTRELPRADIRSRHNKIY